jgi:hypothetical protein
MIEGLKRTDVRPGAVIQWREDPVPDRIGTIIYIERGYATISWNKGKEGRTQVRVDRLVKGGRKRWFYLGGLTKRA